MLKYPSNDKDATTRCERAAELQRRLAGECRAHEQTVAGLLLAQREGALDAELAFRQCATELQQIKGVASLLELSDLLSVIGPLCELMLRTRPRAPAAFLNEFEHWFSLLLRCLRLSAQNVCDPVSIRTAQRGQRVLVRILESSSQAAR